MKVQTLLVSLFAGLAIATPQRRPSNSNDAIQFPDDNDDGCGQGKAIPGPQGTLCIGPTGEILGPPRKKQQQVGGQQERPGSQTSPSGQVKNGKESTCPAPGVRMMRLTIIYIPILLTMLTNY